MFKNGSLIFKIYRLGGQWYDSIPYWVQLIYDPTTLTDGLGGWLLGLNWENFKFGKLWIYFG